MGILEKYKRKKKQQEMQKNLKDAQNNDPTHGIIPYLTVTSRDGIKEMIPYKLSYTQAPAGQIACMPFFSDIPLFSTVSLRLDKEAEETVLDEILAPGGFLAQLALKDQNRSLEEIDRLFNDASRVFMNKNIPHYEEFLEDGFAVLCFRNGAQSEATEVWRTELRDMFEWSLSFELHPEEFAPKTFSRMKELDGGCIFHQSNYLLSDEPKPVANADKEAIQDRFITPHDFLGRPLYFLG